MNKKEYKKKSIPKALKRIVWNTHIGEEIGKAPCKCCNLTEITQMSFHCGHIIAEANGGETNVDNLLPICELCNKSMGTTNLLEFKQKMKSDTSTQIIGKLSQSSQNITVNQKYNLKLLLDKTKKCIRLYYLHGNITEMVEYKKWALVATNGDELPYKLIHYTYNNFYIKTEKNKHIEYIHKKCKKTFTIDIFNESTEYEQKIKYFINHIDCLLDDNEYVVFCNINGFL